MDITRGLLAGLQLRAGCGRWLRWRCGCGCVGVGGVAHYRCRRPSQLCILPDASARVDVAGRIHSSAVLAARQNRQRVAALADSSAPLLAPLSSFRLAALPAAVYCVHSSSQLHHARLVERGRALFLDGRSRAQPAVAAVCSPRLARSPLNCRSAVAALGSAHQPVSFDDGAVCPARACTPAPSAGRAGGSLGDGRGELRAQAGAGRAAAASHAAAVRRRRNLCNLCSVAPFLQAPSSLDTGSSGCSLSSTSLSRQSSVESPPAGTPSKREAAKQLNWRLMHTQTSQQVFDLVVESCGRGSLDSINVTAALQRLAKVGCGRRAAGC